MVLWNIIVGVGQQGRELQEMPRGKFLFHELRHNIEWQNIEWHKFGTILSGAKNFISDGGCKLMDGISGCVEMPGGRFTFHESRHDVERYLQV